MPHDTELIVLAKYMQILSDNFVNHYEHKSSIFTLVLTFIHWSKPIQTSMGTRRQTSRSYGHYVTSDLDEGPIIDQDVIRINHRYNVQDLRKTGRHVESQVLAQTVEYRFA